MGDTAESGGLTLSTAFRRARGGGVSASFHVVEAELLGSLVGQLLELVRGEAHESPPSDDPLAGVLGFGNETARPTDPVVLRLFPDAYRGDDEAASDFRRFTEQSLRETKAGAAATMLASLATAEGARPDDGSYEVDQGEKIKVELNAEEATAWLRTLTDLRLALGTRLGVEEGDEDHWAALPADDPRRHVHDVYDWLGWVQETLIRALSP